MSTVARADVDNLNTLVTVTIEKQDYVQKFETELSKYRQKAHMKGFRKGKTPLSVLKKMYGKSILADVVNELLQQKLFEYIQENNIQYLGQPMPSETQEPVDFDLGELKDFEFIFELGLMPEFKLTGLDKESIFQLQEVELDEKIIDEEMDNARKRFGERQEVEDNIDENDVVTFEAKELASDTPKEGGIHSEFSTLVSKIADEEIRKSVLSMKKGDTLTADIYKLEGDKDAAFVNRYFLNLEEGAEGPENSNFELTIKEISRVTPATMDQEFFDKVFGPGQVSTEEEAREKIREEIASHYIKQSEALLFRDFQNHLMDSNNIPLPDTFLKKWLAVSNENLSEEQLNKEYPFFAKNLQWTLIKNKLAAQFGIRVSREEIITQFKNRILSYLGGGSGAFNDEMLNGIAERMMTEDQKEVEKMSEEILSDKVFDVVKEHVTVNNTKVSLEAFQEIAQKAREEAEKANAFEEE